MDSVAILPVRQGIPPRGGDETVAEAGGAAVLIGSGCADAAAALSALTHGRLAEVGDFAVAGWAAALSPVLRAVPRVLLPGSADGRDLAPRLAAALHRPLLAGAVRVTARGAELARYDEHRTVDVDTAGPFVATLVPGSRAATPATGEPHLEPLHIDVGPAGDAEVLEILEPDPATADLAEASRILCAGAGLTKGDGPESVALLGKVATALGASAGATRVVTDAGWAPFERQIGTTGAVVDPALYVAFGVSGASQHVGGIGAPRDVVSVNTDASAPMTAMAGLGIVTDAQTLLRELADRLGVTP